MPGSQEESCLGRKSCGERLFSWLSKNAVLEDCPTWQCGLRGLRSALQSHRAARHPCDLRSGTLCGRVRPCLLIIGFANFFREESLKAQLWFGS